MTGFRWTDGFDGPTDGEYGDFQRPLTADLVPSVTAPFWMEIAEFALTFDGYAAVAESTDLGDLASRAIDRWNDTGLLPSSLVQLRSCLFFEQRRYRHMDMELQGEDMAYIRALVEAIRRHAQSPTQHAPNPSR